MPNKSNRFRSFGDRLKHARTQHFKKRNNRVYSQQELADFLTIRGFPCSRNRIIRWEKIDDANGKPNVDVAPPWPQELFIISELLKVPWAWLAFGLGEIDMDSPISQPDLFSVTDLQKFLFNRLLKKDDEFILALLHILDN